MQTLYMKARSSQISMYVIFSGDPWRVNVFKNYLTNIEEIGFKREFNTITGYYEGVKITATSTGIGSPSAAIAMEEMYECGMEVAIRMGTVMALNKDMVGSFLIPLGSMRLESTSDQYIDKSYPAIADFDLVGILDKTVEKAGYKFVNGIHASLDGYYTDMKESKFSIKSGKNPLQSIEKLCKHNILGLDMESSAMLTIGRLMNIKAAVITLATVSKNLESSLNDYDRKKMEEELCKITLDAIVGLDKKKEKK